MLTEKELMSKIKKVWLFEPTNYFFDSLAHPITAVRLIVMRLIIKTCLFKWCTFYFTLVTNNYERGISQGIK